MGKSRVISCSFAVFALFFIMATASADVIITLKNGKTHKVKVDPGEVESITFEEKFRGRDRDRYEKPAPPAITWDFETGRLDGWTATGTAFNRQPTYGDNPTARNRGQASNHQGNYWIGTYEDRPTPQDRAGATQGDGPKGTLTSESFTIRHSTISFLVGGGCDMYVARVELVVDGVVHRQATGKCTETMTREEWNVSNLIGKEASIRLVDNHSGGWGHINFDDVRFY